MRRILVFIFAVFIGVVVLLAPFFVFNFQNGESFFGVRWYEDAVSVSTNPYLLMFSYVDSLPVMFFVTLVVALSVIVLFLLLLRPVFPMWESFYASMILVFSPPFISALYFYPEMLWVLLFLLLGVYFQLLKSEKKYLAVIFYAALPFFSVVATVIGLISIICIGVGRKYQRSVISVYVVILVLFGLLLSRSVFSSIFSSNPFLVRFLIDFGGNTGVSLATLVLGFVGVVVTWKKNVFFIFGVFAAALIVVLSYWDSSLSILFSVFLAIFAFYGLYWLLKRVWKSSLIKYLTILLVLQGMFFSTLSFEERIVDSQPRGAMIDSLVWLADYDSDSAVVLSAPEQGSVIVFFSNKTPYLRYSDSEFDSKFEVAKVIFQSRDLEKTFSLLDREGIRYIVFDDKIRSNIWDDVDEGLLFLFRNERFKRVYARDDVVIWEYKK